MGKQNNTKSPVLLDKVQTEKLIVEQLISDLDNMLFAIKKADELLINLEAGDTKEHYKKELDVLLKDYNDLCLQLRVLLYNYFKLEQKYNLPFNLTYRRLYKKLK